MTKILSQKFIPDEKNFDKKCLNTGFQTQNGENVRHTLFNNLWYRLMITKIFTTSQDFEQYYGNKISIRIL